MIPSSPGCDGKADDTAAIRKALESVRSNSSPKKVLYFPAGTYRNTGYFSFQGNTSIGSRRFFHAKWVGPWGSQATLQDNLIIDPTDPTPVVIENYGPNMIIDNTFRAAGDSPLVVNTPPS